MTITEARQIKGGERVKLINYPSQPYNNSIGYIPWVDRIYDEEPHAVVFPWTHKNGYMLIKIENLELITDY